MIIRGFKFVEIRGWDVRRRGLIALHSPWRIDWGACYFYGYKEPWALPRGAIIAVAEIAEVNKLTNELSMEILHQHRNPLPQTGGSFAIVLKDVRSLRKPVRCRGRQYFFPLGDKVAGHVREYAGLGANLGVGKIQIDRKLKAKK